MLLLKSSGTFRVKTSLNGVFPAFPGLALSCPVSVSVWPFKGKSIFINFTTMRQLHMTATPWNTLLFSPLSRTSLAAFGLSTIFGGKVRGIGKVFVILLGKRGAFLNGHVWQFKRLGGATKIHQSGAKSVNRRVLRNGRGTVPPFPHAPNRLDGGHKVAGGVKN